MKKEKLLLSYNDVKEKTLRLLEFRSHSVGELKRKLRSLGAKEEHIEDVIAFCKEYGFVDDEDYAMRKARDLYNLKKYGPHRIYQELRAKDIEPCLIEAAISQIEFCGDVLKPLVQKKLKGDFERKNIDRCIRYFIYRGYDIKSIKDCIDEIKGETDDL